MIVDDPLAEGKLTRRGKPDENPVVIGNVIQHGHQLYYSNVVIHLDFVVDFEYVWQFQEYQTGS